MTHRDAVEAFADGECVPAEALDAALADPEARAYLLDVLALRGLVGDQPDAVLSRGPRATGVARSSAARGWWWPAVAALVVGASALGFVAGRGTAPAPTATPDGTVTTSDTAARVSAPAPTHVIRLENGVNWNERSGGN